MNDVIKLKSTLSTFVSKKVDSGIIKWKGWFEPFAGKTLYYTEQEFEKELSDLKSKGFK